MAKNKQPLISLCMIVKNEEDVLERCLESVKDIIDEWCILDTGSTDSTPAIIEKFSGNPPKIEPFDNFVTTKNVSISHATGKYILWMDADEIMQPEALNILKRYAISNEDIVVLNEMVGSTSYFKTRIWFRKPEAKFFGPNTHEYLSHNGKTLYDASIKVSEIPNPTKDWSHKFTRDEIAIKKYLAEVNPLDVRGHFYLAQTLHACGQSRQEEAIQYYIKYLTLPNNYFLDEKVWAAYIAAQCYWMLGETKLALDILDIGIGIDSRRAELYYYKGFINYYLEEWQEAIVWFERALNCKIPDGIIGFIEKDKYYEQPLDYVSICYFKIKDWDNAYRCAKLLNDKYNGSDGRILQNVTVFGQKVNMKIAMYMGWFHEEIYGGLLDDKGLAGVESTYIRLSESFARLGYNIDLFTSCLTEHMWKGVHYIPYSDFQKSLESNKYEVIITSRNEEIFDNISGPLKILWMQDMGTHRMSSENRYAHGQDLTIVSSEAHKNYLMKNYLHQVGKDNIKILPIAIEKEYYMAEMPSKDPYRLIYSSAPDRGLEYLFAIWPQLTEAIPEINLHIYYGMESIKKVWELRGQVEYAQRYIDMINKMVEAYPNIIYHDRVSKKDLAINQMKGSLAVYPNSFFETYCLTIAEYQAAGLGIITNGRGAIKNVLMKNSNITITGAPSNTITQQLYFDNIKQLLLENNQLTLKRMQTINRGNSLNILPSWDDVANMWKILIQGKMV